MRFSTPQSQRGEVCGHLQLNHGPETWRSCFSPCSCPLLLHLSLAHSKSLTFSSPPQPISTLLPPPAFYSSPQLSSDGQFLFGAEAILSYLITFHLQFLSLIPHWPFWLQSSLLPSSWISPASVSSPLPPSLVCSSDSYFPVWSSPDLHSPSPKLSSFYILHTHSGIRLFESLLLHLLRCLMAGHLQGCCYSVSQNDAFVWNVWFIFVVKVELAKPQLQLLA